MTALLQGMAVEIQLMLQIQHMSPASQRASAGSRVIRARAGASATTRVVVFVILGDPGAAGISSVESRRSAYIMAYREPSKDVGVGERPEWLGSRCTKLSKRFSSPPMTVETICRLGRLFSFLFKPHVEQVVLDLDRLASG